MTDSYKVVIVADSHVGADRRPWLKKLGVTPAQWDAPLHEAVAYAVEHDALLVVAGDTFDKRPSDRSGPTPDDYKRARILRDALLIGGNHDESVDGRSSDLWWASGAMTGQAAVTGHRGLQIVALPWPMPSTYGCPSGLSLKEENDWTQRAVMDRLTELAEGLDPTRPAIFSGHLSVIYGTVKPDSPGLLMGKDIDIPWAFVQALPNIGFIGNGHIHDGTMPGYIGSPQPTDWGEAGQTKSFTVVTIKRDDASTEEATATVSLVNGWRYVARRIPYTTSLCLLDVRAAIGDDGTWELPTAEFDEYAHYDAARATVTAPEGVEVPVAEICAALAKHATTVGDVVIERQVTRAARVETETPMASMGPLDAFALWLETRAPEHAEAVLAAAGEIMEVPE